MLLKLFLVLGKGVKMFIPREIVKKKLRAFLEEDLGHGDVTTDLLVTDGTIIEAEIIAKESGVLAGVEEVKPFLEDFGLKVEKLKGDGDQIKEGEPVLKIIGDAKTVLTVERTALNVLCRMSGIATLTAKLVEAVRKAGFRTLIACTRKTAPGLEYFDKKAVRIGGGDTHRLHLDDMILIKDNHIKIAGSVSEVVKKAKEKASFSKKIEVEVSNLAEALEAAKAGADIIMLDNFTSSQIEKVLSQLEKEGLRRKVLVEASGGINEDNVVEFASTGVDIISVGILTHSAKALDLSLEVRKV